MNPILLKAVGIDFLIQWGGYALAATLQTERFYDFLGTGTFSILSLYTYFANGTQYLRQKIVTGMVVCWSLRLGSFLVRRILKDKMDKRFNNVRDKPLKFFIYWTIQAIWILVTAFPVYLVNTNNDNPPFQLTDYAGWTIWAIGFLIEAISDQQKFNFRLKPENKEKFISTGLWRYSRHPNYFGEISLWFGAYFASFASLKGLQHLSVLSPIFVALLLTKVSGIPLLERQDAKRWKGVQKWEDYVRKTSILIPWPPK